MTPFIYIAVGLVCGSLGALGMALACAAGQGAGAWLGCAGGGE